MEPYDLKVKIEDIINNPYKAPEVKYNEVLNMLAEAHIEGQKQERERIIKEIKDEITLSELLSSSLYEKISKIITGDPK